MQCTKVEASLEQLLDPLGGAWQGVAGETIALDATPLANQPSEYIKASRDARQIGKVKSLLVQAVHNGQEIFFRLSWADAAQNRTITDTTVFVDACGVLLPLKGGEPPIDEMGSEQAPVNAWHWRADLEGETAHNTVAQGLGTTQFSERSAIRAKAVWGQGAWAVVFARALAVPEQAEETVQLSAGAAVKVGFAVWEGSNGERGGLKSFSKEWRELVLEA